MELNPFIILLLSGYIMAYNCADCLPSTNYEGTLTVTDIMIIIE